MDSQKYENKPSLEHKSLLSRWSIQCSNSISVWRQYRLLGVRIVNGVDKYVTESMLTKKRGGHSFGETHCWSKTKTEAHSNVDFRFYSCSWKEVDRHWNTTTTRSQVLWSVKSHDPIATTESISSSRKRRSNPLKWHHWRMQEEEVRRCFAMVTWRLEINSGKRKKERRTYSNIVWIQTHPNQFLYLRAIQGHSGDNAVDPALQDNVMLPKGFTEYLVGNASELNSIIRNGIIPRGKSLKRRRQGVFFTTVSHGRWIWYGTNSKRSDETKNRARQQYLETPSKYCMMAQFEARSRERLAILPHAVICGLSRKHTTCSLHWANGMYGNTGRALPESSLNSESVTCRTKIEHAIWSTRSTKPRRKIIFGNNQAIRKVTGKFCNNTVDYRTSGAPLSAIEQQDTNRQNKVKKLIEKFENHKQKESFLQDLSQTQKINKFKRESQDLIADLNNTKIFELCEKFFQTAMSWLQCLLGNKYNLLQLWKKYEIFAVSNRVRAEQLRRHLNPWICYEEEQPNTDLLNDKECTTKRNRCWKKARQKKHGRHPTILARWYASETYRTSLSQIGYKRCTTELPWRSFPQSNKSWGNWKFETVDSHDECRKTSATTQSTTCLCSSEKRMQTIARRASGKEERRI